MLNVKKNKILVSRTCTVCNVKKYEVLYKSNFKVEDLNVETFLSRKIPKKTNYRMVKCLGCGLIYSNPIPKKRFIDSLYRDADVPTHIDLENANKVYLYYLRNVLKKIDRNSRILDVGCGNGFFISKLKKIGYINVYGVEPSRSSLTRIARGLTRKDIKVGGYDRKMFKKDFFNLICFFQVFDHLTDPNKFLNDCFHNLKKGGYVFALMHNTDALSARLLGGDSPIIDVQHICLFNKKNIKMIFEKNGFVVQRVFTTFSLYSIQYWVKMGPFPKVIKNMISKYASKSRAANFSVPFAAGNMAVIARKS